MSANHQCQWCHIDISTLSALEDGAHQKVAQLERWADNHGPKSHLGQTHAETAKGVEQIAEQMADCVLSRT